MAPELLGHGYPEDCSGSSSERSFRGACLVCNGIERLSFMASAMTFLVACGCICRQRICRHLQLWPCPVGDCHRRVLHCRGRRRYAQAATVHSALPAGLQALAAIIFSALAATMQYPAVAEAELGWWAAQGPSGVPAGDPGHVPGLPLRLCREEADCSRCVDDH